MDDELATWRRRVDPLSQADELDAALFTWLEARSLTSLFSERSQ